MTYLYYYITSTLSCLLESADPIRTHLEASAVSSDTFFVSSVDLKVPELAFRASGAPCCVAPFRSSASSLAAASADASLQLACVGFLERGGHRNDPARSGYLQLEVGVVWNHHELDVARSPKYCVVGSRDVHHLEA
jgi:hypothetical protein